MGQFWERISGIIDGENVKLAESNGEPPTANPVRGFLASVYVLAKQTSQYVSDNGDHEEAPEDVTHSLNGLVKQLEDYTQMDLSAFGYEGDDPTIGEVDRKAHQLKAFLVGCYSIDT